MTAPNKMAKRAAAGTLALAVCFAGGVLGAGAAQADENFNFDTRFGGATRIDTAVQASAAAFNDGSNTVVVVNENRFADGLTASYAAGIADDNAGAPILYVSQNSVPSQTSDEIKRLGAKNVIIVGGTAVVSDGVQASLDSFVDNVTRLSGKDRFETAARVATSGSNDVGTVFIANGDATADALAAGPIAYRSHNPIVLVQRDSVPGSAKAALDRLNEENRIVVGGKAVVSDDGYTAANATARLSGSTRQGTAVELAKYAIANEDGFDSGNIALVGSQDRNAADALVAAPVAGKAGTPILFTEGTSLGSMTTEYLQSIAGDLDGTGYVFGGRAAVPDNVAGEAQAAAGNNGTTTPPVANQGFNITPTDAQTLVIPSGADDTTDDRTYRVSDLNDDLTYRVTLVNAANVNIDSAGKVTFRSSADSASASGFSADPGTRSTVITVVNGSPVAANTQSATAKPVGGNLSFTIDGTNPEGVYPVVYVNGGTGQDADNGGPSERLETQATAAGQFAEGAEKYGLGGLTTYVPVEATAGLIVNGTQITSVNKQAGYVVANTPAAGATPAGPSRTYFFDNNDQFRIAGAPVTLARFVESLSTGDAFNGGTYADDADLQSTFDLNDITPDVVTGATATAVDDTSIRVTWTAASPAPQSYAVYRKAGAETDQLTDYTKVADVSPSASPLEYLDKGLTANTQYSYAITQTVDGDESALQTTGNGGGSAATATTNATGVTAAPQSINAGVTDDSSFAGTVSSGDVYTIGFNRVLNEPAVGAVIRLQDADGESIDLQNVNDTATPGGADTTFRLNTTTQTFEGKRYAAGTLLTITVGTTNGFSAITDRDGNTSNNNGSIDYPATITGQNGGITAQVNGRSVAWNPSTSADSELQTGATAPTTSGTDVLAPTITAGGYVSGSTTQVTLTASEEVRGAVGDGSGDGSITASRFAYDADGVANNADVSASSAVLSNGGTTITLTFPSGTVDSTSATDLVRYAPDGSIGDVVDTNENRLGTTAQVIS